MRGMGVFWRENQFYRKGLERVAFLNSGTGAECIVPSYRFGVVPSQRPSPALPRISPSLRYALPICKTSFHGDEVAGEAGCDTAVSLLLMLHHPTC